MEYKHENYKRKNSSYSKGRERSKKTKTVSSDEKDMKERLARLEVKFRDLMEKLDKI